MLHGTNCKSVTRLLALAFCAVALFLGLATRARAQESESGAGLYKTKCIACHGADGSGDTPVGKSLKSADLRSPEVQKKSDAELADFIATGKGNMPSFRSSTSDQELHAIVAYVRSFAAKKSKKAESKAP
jgi:cytochrome c6